jgi:CRISPR-associated endonuclease/helicase Cas3
MRRLKTTSATPLLAKPPKGKRCERTLVGHTQDVLDAFVALFGTPEGPSELTRSWARFFRLQDTHTFLVNGTASVICHDWGKANDGFQGMLFGKCRQLLRHEQISLLLMTWPSIWEWLGRNTELDLDLILAAVAGHHLKARDVEFGQPQTEIDTLLRVRWDHPDWQDYLPALAARLKLPGPAPVDDLPKLWGFEAGGPVADLGEALHTVKDRLERIESRLIKDSHRRRLLWAVRAALIAADAAGSGLFREGRPVASWIADAFKPTGRLDKEAVEQKIIKPRMEKMGNRWRDWNDFQKACANPAMVPSRALLLAPCGSGKTLAAWRWIAARCEPPEGPRGRVIFLYPTRGTATEGYRDYVSYAGHEEAALVHGTAEIDVDGIHSDLKDEDRVNAARLFALRQWPKRLFSATVDQFLGFLQHGYGPTCHLPLLADSVVVFDEVHSYDRGMFSALLQFLDNFDIPVLCMTATLLEKRRDQLAKRLDAVFDGLKTSGGELREIADYPRYRIIEVANEKKAEEEVRDALEQGHRVLWVVNKVDCAQQIARSFAADPKAKRLTTADGVPVFCYHSRFRLKDRKGRHDAVVDAFRPSPSNEKTAVLAVTTQVCEMSLDLDADVLVTEYAPASSLVQRMGRCCRDAEAHKSNPKREGLVILYRPEDELPYTKHDMIGVAKFVADLKSKGIARQSDLEDLLADVPQAAELPKECRFIESGPWAASGEENFRDIDEFTRQALLPCDVEDYLALRRSARPWEADGLIVPVPKNLIDPRPDERLPPWLKLAKGGRYSCTLGYCESGERPEPIIV